MEYMWPVPQADPAPAIALELDGAAKLQALREIDRHVLAIASRLNQAASGHCSLTRYDSGWVLHGLAQYSVGLQPAAARFFEIGVGQIGVLALEDDGPAFHAGIQENDVLVAVSDHSVSYQALGRRSDAAGVEAAVVRVDALMDRPRVTIRVLRSSQEFELGLSPRRRCDWKVQVTPSQNVGANADGRHISVTSRLVALAEQDDILAFVLAHEMAHNLQRERPGFADRPVREREREADRVGMILAARAGYDTSGAGNFVRRLGRISWFSRFGWGAHDAPAVRAAALDRIHEEIATEGAHALPLQLGRPPPG